MKMLRVQICMDLGRSLRTIIRMVTRRHLLYGLILVHLPFGFTPSRSFPFVENH